MHDAQHILTKRLRQAVVVVGQVDRAVREGSNSFISLRTAGSFTVVFVQIRLDSARCIKGVTSVPGPDIAYFFEPVPRVVRVRKITFLPCRIGL